MLMHYGRAAVDIECFCDEINCKHMSYYEERLKQTYKHGVIDGTVASVSSILGQSPRQKIVDLIDRVETFLGTK